MTKVAIVYHSGYGHTTKAAEAVQAGAIAAGAEAELILIDKDGNITDDQWASLAAAQAIVFGSPTYMGTVSWQFKKFADASSKPWYTQVWKDKIAAGFTNSATMNGDKLSTLHYLFTFSQQHGMIWVGTGLMPSNSTAAQRNDINFIGSSSGLMTQSPSDSSPEEGPLPGDLETAKLFGQRIATVAKKLA